MAEYASDHDGVVHLISPDGGNEFTYCGRPADGDVETAGFYAEPSSGPATCRACKEAVNDHRNRMRGAKWRLEGAEG